MLEEKLSRVLLSSVHHEGMQVYNVLERIEGNAEYTKFWPSCTWREFGCGDGKVNCKRIWVPILSPSLTFDAHSRSKALEYSTLTLRMGNTSSSQSQSQSEVLSSPSLLVSLSVEPGSIVFPHHGVCRLVITITNPTSQAITFLHPNTPLNVSRCFTRGLDVEQPWMITDLTTKTDVPIIVSPGIAHKVSKPTEDIKLEEGDYMTIPPTVAGVVGEVILSFDLTFTAGLTPSHDCEISMDEFEISELDWSYGGKEVVNGLEREIKRRAAVRRRETKDWEKGFLAPRGMLRLCCVKSAVVGTRWDEMDKKDWGLDEKEKREVRKGGVYGDE
jgi:hypothetical protein